MGVIIVATSGEGVGFAASEGLSAVSCAMLVMGDLTGCHSLFHVVHPEMESSQLILIPMDYGRML